MRKVLLNSDIMQNEISLLFQIDNYTLYQSNYKQEGFVRFLTNSVKELKMKGFEYTTMLLSLQMMQSIQSEYLKRYALPDGFGTFKDILEQLGLNTNYLVYIPDSIKEKCKP